MPGFCNLRTLIFGLGIVFIACGDDASSPNFSEGGEKPSSSSLSPAEGNSDASESSSSLSSAEENGGVAESSSPAEGNSNASESSGSLSSAEGNEITSSSNAPDSSEGNSEAASSSSSAAPASSDESDPDDSGDDGKCTDCDSYTAADPTLTEKGGKGSVTTYGSITEKETSLGGACNYGQTNIQYYAAIHVNVSPGDDKGPWDGGAACGGCVRVKAKTPDGWKRVTVRITDRCPDANCGVDLGGAPAADIMGNTVGRYYGEWEFVSCEGVEGVWGDSTSLWVKESASTFWSIVHVRNPKDMVKSISIYGVDSDESYELEMVVGTENFWTVPLEVLQTDKKYRVVVKYRTGTDDEWHIKGSELAVGEANLYLYEHRE